MRALKFPCGGQPVEIDIEDDYKAIQKEVGGCFDCASWVFNDAPTIYLNDEGKLTGQPNRAVYATENDAGSVTWGGEIVKAGDVLDIIYGDFICVGFDPETGNNKDITDGEIAVAKARFKDASSGFIEAMRIKARTQNR